MKTLYFDCFSGISGDMTIGALIDLGVDFDYLRTEISKLPIDGFELGCERTVRANISAAKFEVRIDDGPGPAHERRHEHPHGHGHAHDHSHEDFHAYEHGESAGHTHDGEGHAHAHPHVHRKASDIIGMLRSSRLPPRARDRAVRIFERLAVSEGRVHQLPAEDVEFHEVGAIDSIVDIVGAALGLEALQVERFVSAPINVGGGFIHCQHGVYPVPAPATANLLVGAPVYSRHVDAELVTPTGAAILAATVDRFGALDGMTIEKIGYGAGTRDLGEFPNCLRLFLVREEAAPREAADRVVVIETNIDDMSAEALAYAVEALMGSGALDVVTIPVLMKKGRPGHLVQVLASPDRKDQIIEKLFRETTTIGVRTRIMERSTLDRERVGVETPHGAVHLKVSRLEGKVMNVSPEYEDCARLARRTGLPFEEIRIAAVRAYQETGPRDETPATGRGGGRG